MLNRFFTASLLLVLLVSLPGIAQALPLVEKVQPALVYVNLSGSDDMSRFASTQLPMYAVLERGLLTGADQAGQQTLLQAGLNIQVLDTDLNSGAYYLVGAHSSRPAPDFASFGQILLNTGNGVLLRMDPSQVDALTKASAELQAITLTPKPVPNPQKEGLFPSVIQPDPAIQGMIDQVTETQVYTYDRQLAGELPVRVDRAPYIITSRNTNSGIPIQKTTHYIGDHMQNLGMNVEYHVWNNSTNPNVIGEIPGLVNPDDIYIIGAHIDDVNGTKGADDNASGSVATLLAADILSQYQWGCTLRFAFWTGEEQGLLGSAAYAQRSHQYNENILGYLNLDMIAWNTIGSPNGIDILYNPGMPLTHGLAQLYADIVYAYNINLIPELNTSLGGGSDHSSFWNYGYTAILSIEDQNDFNPYYHGPGDTPAHTDPIYFTNFVKASIGTFAHMTGCLIPPGQGFIDGHVTEAGDGVPIEGAAVTSENVEGVIYPTSTNASGYYTLTLPVDTYTVTVSANGYVPDEVSGVEVTSDATTTLDFALQPVCYPLSGLDFTWLPLNPLNDEPVEYTATAVGTEPINFQWNFGDTHTGLGATITHAYLDAGSYTVTLSATNACDTDVVHKEIIVLQKIQQYFLPLMNK